MTHQNFVIFPSFTKASYSGTVSRMKVDNVSALVWTKILTSWWIIQVWTILLTVVTATQVSTCLSFQILWTNSLISKLIHPKSLFCWIQSKKIFTDNCPVKNTQYDQFELRNNRGENSYKKLTLEDCQLLCQKTHGCIFFNHDERSKICWLKWGLGFTMQIKPYQQFGPKYCPSNKILISWSWNIPV